MNTETVKLVVNELREGDDTPELMNVYEKIASRITEYSNEGLLRQLIAIKTRKNYLIHLDTKDELERRLILRELNIRNIEEIDINEVT